MSNSSITSAPGLFKANSTKVSILTLDAPVCLAYFRGSFTQRFQQRKEKLMKKWHHGGLNRRHASKGGIILGSRDRT
jgi:hypothetical protein